MTAVTDTDTGTDHDAAMLPVASARDVRSYARRLTLHHPAELAGALALHALAAACGLLAPRLLGELVEQSGRGVDHAARTGLLICLSVALQAGLLQVAVFASARLGEKVLAELREEFVERVLALPPAIVERAGAGDLVSRTTRDVDALSRAVRQAVPDTLVSAGTIVLTLGAVLLLGPLLALPCLVAVPVLWGATRWYLSRARAGYLAANASYAQLAEGLTETVEGARTVEALRIAHRRQERAGRDIARSYAAERHTLWLRTVFLPISDTAYVLPVVATLVIGGLYYLHHMASLAAVTAAVLYVQQTIGPVDTVIAQLDTLQVGGASLARLLGVAQAAAPARQKDPTQRRRGPGLLWAVGVGHEYRAGQPVLRGVDLEVRPGERLAIVGSSGAGKSTLGRLLAGIHPPHRGAVLVDGAVLAELPLDERRRQVALVTQEHHVFHGSLRENLALGRAAADERQMVAALRAVEAWEWAGGLGLDTPVGAGGVELSPARSQQLALARLVLADPRVLILDEATSLVDPRAARRLERSLAAVLAGRTVIAIAHRLHTARDADRVAVMEAGQIVELGSHEELLALGGVYAGLWAVGAAAEEEGNSPDSNGD
ncbi:ABC transporter ATP-binding protein/permease [Kitasatospora sp. NBC_01250]|uniref:ABC transporter ATP-binding protein n=1 Tax=Kitasatospora sp. NBC_01250 TaxID=2903571 RepID=UPI002E3586C9|nr:ABC transporter ATP-binding protein [Kitasatospora sp. NBC_01250]